MAFTWLLEVASTLLNYLTRERTVDGGEMESAPSMQSVDSPTTMDEWEEPTSNSVSWSMTPAVTPQTGEANEVAQQFRANDDAARTPMPQRNAGMTHLPVMYRGPWNPIRACEEVAQMTPILCMTCAVSLNGEKQMRDRVLGRKHRRNARGGVRLW